MKKAIYSCLLVFLLFGGCDIGSEQPQTPSILEANVTIGECSQAKMALVDAYYFVYIDYTIENTSSVEIDFYEIRFKATDNNGTVYYGKGLGINLKPGDSYIDEGFIDTNWKRAEFVYYINYYLVIGGVSKESMDYDRSLNIVRK